MKPYKDYVHRRRVDDHRVAIVEVTDEDVLSGIVVMVVLGLILGTMIGLAI
jgi:hypothetical protein